MRVEQSKFADLGDSGGRKRGEPLQILRRASGLAIARILEDSTRKRTKSFSELQSHHLFQVLIDALKADPVERCRKRIGDRLRENFETTQQHEKQT